MNNMYIDIVNSLLKSNIYNSMNIINQIPKLLWLNDNQYNELFENNYRGVYFNNSRDIFLASKPCSSMNN